MHTTETALYRLIVGYGIVISFFSLVQIFSSIWLNRKFREKRKQREAAVLLSRETERERISLTLHDQSGPMIYRIRRQLEQAAKGGTDTTELILDALDGLNRHDVMLHAISNDLYPLHMDRMGLCSTLTDLVAVYQENETVAIFLNCARLPCMSKESEIQVYRIAEEIILNTVKHSQASKLNIDIDWVDGALLFKSQDDGIGFDVKKVAGENKRLGISTIYSYVTALRGKVFLSGSNGCRWEIRLQPVLLPEGESIVFGFY